jgi:nucleoside-diphosphate-sugar epimerase
MKIAITGGSGFIGKWLIKKLGGGNDLIVLGRKNVEAIQVGGNTYKYVSTDYSKERLQGQLIGCEAVVHLAAKRPGKDTGETFDAHYENIRISADLFEACRILNINKIIHMSSRSVYGPANSVPWSEEQAARPASYYGIAKLAVEKLAENYNSRYGMEIVSLRAAQVFGVGEREGYIMAEFIKSASAGQALTVYGRGEGRREYIYIKDIVDAVESALGKKARGVYNAGTGMNYSHKELAEIINEVFDNTGNIKYMPDMPEDKGVCLMDTAMIRRELGWEPKWMLKDALMDMKKILLSQGSSFN